MKIKEVMGPRKPKPLGPLTPAQARLSSLKQNIENSKRALQTEKEFQRRQRDRLRQLPKRPGTSF
jgi:hypothetical protein